ncbi:hypothetical protein [Pectobacterium aroidearum]|uniref:hypothetical protein n=1 Tax=Pectobacterium aroidearum TaxID=1201031 RepID=UPI0033074388
MSDSSYSIAKITLDDGTEKYVIYDMFGLPIATKPRYFDSEEDAYYYLLRLLKMAFSEEYKKLNEKINNTLNKINENIEKELEKIKKIHDEMLKIRQILDNLPRLNKTKKHII